jgi:hypothetical protein
VCRRRGRRVHIIITSRLTGRGYNDVVGPPCVDPRYSLIRKFTGSSRYCPGSMRATTRISIHLSGLLLCRVAGGRDEKVGRCVYEESVISSKECVLYFGGNRFESCGETIC